MNFNLLTLKRRVSYVITLTLSLALYIEIPLFKSSHENLSLKKFKTSFTLRIEVQICILPVKKGLNMLGSANALFPWDSVLLYLHIELPSYQPTLLLDITSSIKLILTKYSLSKMFM